MNISEPKIFRRGNGTILSGFETLEDVQKHLKMIREDPRFRSAISVHGKIHITRNYVTELEQILAQRMGKRR